MNYEFLVKPGDPPWREIGLHEPVVEDLMPCPYLEGRQARERAVFPQSLVRGELYQSLMNKGWRRSGPLIYQTSCPSCNECRPIRVPVAEFTPNRTQRKLLNRNRGFSDKVCRPRPTDENFELFCEYQVARHRGDMCTKRHQFEGVLFNSCVRSVMVEFRDADSGLAGVSLIDIGPGWGSGVYSWFAPELESRSMGTWMVLWALMNLAPQFSMKYYYLGLFIRGCRKMNYKSNFRPCEIGNADGQWERVE